MKRVAILIFVLGAALTTWWFFSPPSSAQAAAIVAECADQERSKCYERVVPALFPSMSLPHIFDIIREIRRLDSSYQFCHVLAHKLGEQVVAEDPEKWIDVISLNPSGSLCSNGFIHGVIVGRFRNDVLDDVTLEKTISDFARACEPRTDWQPSGLDQAICYHGMGHLFMFITNANISKSLNVCAQIASSPTGNFMRVCREGVFMQIYQPLEPDDFALVELLPEKPTIDNYRRLCAAYDNNEDEGACLREAWPFFREEILQGDVDVFCSEQPNATETDRCYESATTIIGRQSLGNADRAADACLKVPTQFRSMCFITVAQALLEEDRTQGAAAVAFCNRAPEPTSNECVMTLASRAQWIFPEKSPEREQFCKALPSEYRAYCED